MRLIEEVQKMEVKQTTCNYCSIACNLDVYVEDSTIHHICPTEHYPVNQGFCCIKGLSLDKQNTIFQNPVLPLLRNEKGEMEHISWDEAFKLFATKIKGIQEQYGKKSVAFISTGQLLTEEMALLGHIARDYLGIDGDGNTRLCMATSVVAHKQSFGFDAPPYTLEDLELTDTMIFIGANPVVAHPILWGRAVKNTEAYKVVIDPRFSETAHHADLYMNIKPKADLTLLYTLANVLIEKGWINEEYIEKHTEHFEEFKEHVKKYTLMEVEEQTGISAGEVKKLAEIIHRGKRVSFWWTMGVNQSYQAVRTAQAIINLALMTGNIGRPGTGPNSITGQCNALGSRLFSNTTGLYGGGEYNNEARRKVVAEALGMEPSDLPNQPSIPYDQIVEGINKGEIKGLWIACTNPASSWINNQRFIEAAKKLEFFVVQDIYSDTETTRLCHMLLPSTSGLKKQGCIINTERRISAVTPVLKKEKDEKTDYDILLGIGEALGMGKLLEGWRTPQEAFETIKKCTKGAPSDITGVTYESITRSKGIQWPHPEGEVLKSDQRRLFEDGKFFTPTGKAQFVFEDVVENPVHTSTEYPYLLNTGRATVGQWHTLTRTREIPAVYAITPHEAYINLHPKLAARFNIQDMDLLEVASQTGVKRMFRARLSTRVNVNHLFAPLHYAETNALLPYCFDPYSKQPSYKMVAVNIRKVADDDRKTIAEAYYD